jgi:hypothetical protein
LAGIACIFEKPEKKPTNNGGTGISVEYVHSRCPWYTRFLTGPPTKTCFTFGDAVYGHARTDAVDAIDTRPHPQCHPRSSQYPHIQRFWFYDLSWRSSYTSRRVSFASSSRFAAPSNNVTCRPHTHLLITDEHIDRWSAFLYSQPFRCERAVREAQFCYHRSYTTTKFPPSSRICSSSKRKLTC